MVGAGLCTSCRLCKSLGAILSDLCAQFQANLLGLLTDIIKQFNSVMHVSFWRMLLQVITEVQWAETRCRPAALHSPKLSR